MVLKYSPMYKPDPSAAASVQPEQASPAARPTKRISLKYNLRVEDAPQPKSAASGMLGPLPESSADSIPALQVPQPDSLGGVKTALRSMVARGRWMWGHSDVVQSRLSAAK